MGRKKAGGGLWEGDKFLPFPSFPMHPLQFRASVWERGRFNANRVSNWVLRVDSMSLINNLPFKTACTFFKILKRLSLN